jgi:hypothetical protein
VVRRAQLSVSAGGVVDNLSTGFSLWHVRTLAAWLIVGAAVIGVAFLLVAPSSARRSACFKIAGRPKPPRGSIRAS